jgi:hypothetical protein
MGQLELIGTKLPILNGPMREFFPAAAPSAMGPPDGLGSHGFQT